MTEATFAAGCFWGVEETFRQVPGVSETAVGYMGGDVQDPSYHDVCTGMTGHAEVVHLSFDPSLVSYEALVEIFWRCHDPTQLNRQGPDLGTQYRTAIFFHSPEQEQAARASLQERDASGDYLRPIATVIEPAREFWPAEEYHQKYLMKRGRGACGI